MVNLLQYGIVSYIILMMFITASKIDIIFHNPDDTNRSKNTIKHFTYQKYVALLHFIISCVT